MAFLNDDWSYLPGPVIDTLVAVLRRLDRWKIDGPNLRSLNRHWREQIDYSVTEIRPAGKGEFCWDKLESLSKFPHLRHLRLNPFLRTSSPVKGSKKLSTRMDCLTQLRSLRDLELHGRTSRSLRLLPADAFPTLTSVVFEDVNFTEGTSISLLRLSPIQNVTFIGRSCCRYFQYPWNRTLRSLNFVTNSVSPVFMNGVTELTFLESLSIRSKERSQHIQLKNAEMFSCLTSLVSLHLPDSIINYPCWITALTNLEALSLRIKDYNNHEKEIWKLLQSLDSLKSLALFHRLTDVQYFAKFIKCAKNLRSLEFLEFPAADHDHISLLTKLTRLGIECHIWSPKVQEVFQLSSLQECFLRGYSLPNSILDPSRILCQNLVVLEVKSDRVCSIISQIACLKSLKKVCLYNYYAATLNAFSELRTLPYLKELCISNLLDNECIDHTTQLQSLFEKLDLLCLSHCRFRLLMTPWLHTLLPHVKMTNSLAEFSNLSKIGHKSLRSL
eukprot:g6387.t1